MSTESIKQRSNSQNRLVWMDLARGICILLVLLVHAQVAITGFTPYQPPSPVFAFNMFLDPFRMPMLMFLSGMLLHKSLDKPPRVYVFGKFAQIYWPFLIFSLLVLVVEDRLTLVNMLKVPISSPTLLWYLWFLFVYYLLALALVRFRIPLAAVAVAALIAAPFLPDFVRMSRFAYLFFFFLAGHLCIQYMARLSFGTLTGGIGLVAAVIGGYVSATFGTIKYEILYVWVPLGMVLFMLSIAPLYKSSGATQWLEWVGRNSIVFYVVHFPVQLTTIRIADAYGQFGFMGLYAITLLFSLSICGLVQLLRERSRSAQALFDFRKLLPRHQRSTRA